MTAGLRAATAEEAIETVQTALEPGAEALRVPGLAGGSEQAAAVQDQMLRIVRARLESIAWRSIIGTVRALAAVGGRGEEPLDGLTQHGGVRQEQPADSGECEHAIRRIVNTSERSDAAAFRMATRWRLRQE